MSGFFLGGAAEGMNARAEIDVKNRGLDIKENELAGAAQRQLATELEKTVAGNVATITGIIQESRKAGASPDQIRKTIAPLVQSFQEVATRTGRNITPAIQQFDALISIPRGAEGEPTPSTEVGKTRADERRGFITPEESAARIQRLTRESVVGNTIEIIRRKLAIGETLTPGEQKVYDDALRGDIFTQILRAQQGGGIPGIPGLPPLPGGR